MMELLLPLVFRNKISNVLIVCPSHKMVQEMLNMLRAEEAKTKFFSNDLYGLRVENGGRRVTLAGKSITFLFEGEMTEEYLRGRACYDIFRIDRLPK